MNQPIRIAILASGNGSNAENICRFFASHETISVSVILSNKKDAFVLQRAKSLNIPSRSFNKAEFRDEKFLTFLSNVDYIILAGFLWLIPSYLVEAYSGKIINIHPALLPKYGGKGMYGDHVHQAVVDAREEESGITIHKVNSKYDEGEIILQKKCKLEQGETAASLAGKVHQLEYAHFPKAIEDYILGDSRIN